MRDKSLKQRMNEGEVLVGVGIPMKTDPNHLDSILQEGGYDFLWVDGQHAPLNEERLADLCKAADEKGIHVQFRIKHTRHTYLVGNYLDLGPSGVEVPQVEEESTVDDAVANFYYPPKEVRSWGGRTRAGLAERNSLDQYPEWWNDHGVMWVQVESIDAVSNARQLARPGVDCLSFGPMDLTFSLRSHPNHPFKTVDDCVRHVVEQLEGTNVAVCYRYSTPETRQRIIDMGVTVMLEQPTY